jgi:uncharacterized protein (DUF1015 family)
VVGLRCTVASAELPPKARLRLRPFTALRYNPAVIDDIGAVVCPPYDAMDRATIEAMLQSHPRNIARLILPRLVREPLGADDPYQAAAERLARWRLQKDLIVDPEPAIYVYEYGDSEHRVCGLVGALDLNKHNRQMVLEHEDVIPAIVDDRLEMVAASRANLEPILLLYDGERGMSGVIARARSRDPLMDVIARDGTHHRLWTITDLASLAEIKMHLKARQALIADGHHRYETYRQLRRRHRIMGDHSGPWDRGLALLIDQSEFPLELGPIHRSIDEINLDTLPLPQSYQVGAPQPLEGALPRPPTRPGEIVLTDGVVEQTVRFPDTTDESVTDVGRLHDELVPAWQVTEDRIGYHHSVDQTVQHAAREDGLGILLHPTTLSQVMAVARAGKVMPRKSTSFGPKPHIGIIMRAFNDH